MSARDEVLGRVRAALGGVDAPSSPRTARVSGDQDPVRLADLFAERVEDYRATVTRCGRHDVAERMADALRGATRVVVPDGFPFDLPDGVKAVPDTDLGWPQLDALDAVVTTSSVGIATTGTIVLEHGTGQGRRAVTLLPDLHVCVVDVGDLVLGVPDAVARLDPRRPQTWISGPSATSDIELDRVEGVHGPRRLHVLLVSG